MIDRLRKIGEFAGGFTALTTLVVWLLGGLALFLSGIAQPMFEKLGLLALTDEAMSRRLFFDLTIYIFLLVALFKNIYLTSSSRKENKKWIEEEKVTVVEEMKVASSSDAAARKLSDHYKKKNRRIERWSDQVCQSSHKAAHNTRDLVIRVEELRDASLEQFRCLAVPDNAKKAEKKIVEDFYRASLQEYNIHCKDFADTIKDHVEVYLRAFHGGHARARVCIGTIKSGQPRSNKNKAQHGFLGLDIEDDGALVEYAVLDSETLSALTGHTKNLNKFCVSICIDQSLYDIATGEIPSYCGDFNEESRGGISRLESGFKTKLVLPIRFGSVSPKFDVGPEQYNLIGFLTVLVNIDIRGGRKNRSSDQENRLSLMDSIACFSDSLAIGFRSLHRANEDLRVFCDSGSIRKDRREGDRNEGPEHKLQARDSTNYIDDELDSDIFFLESTLYKELTDLDRSAFN